MRRPFAPDPSRSPHGDHGYREEQESQGTEHNKSTSRLHRTVLVSTSIITAESTTMQRRTINASNTLRTARKPDGPCGGSTCAATEAPVADRRHSQREPQVSDRPVVEESAAGSPRSAEGQSPASFPRQAWLSGCPRDRPRPPADAFARARSDQHRPPGRGTPARHSGRLPCHRHARRTRPRATALVPRPNRPRLS